MTTRAEVPPERAVARVLVVDDEPKLRESLAEGLRLEEWEVITAGTGADAMRLLRADRFDLLVLDWMLPDLDGIEILRRVRADTPRLPVLMITARTAQLDRFFALENGATDYLTKPFGFSELVDRCHALLQPPRAQS